MHLVTVSAVMTSSRLHESGITDFRETGRRDPTLATLAMLCSPPATAAVVAAGKAAVAVAAAMKKVDVGDSNDEAAKVTSRSVVAWPRLPGAMAAAPKPPKVVTPRRDATGVARRAIGRTTARRSYAAAKDGGTQSKSAPRLRRSDAAVATDGGTLLMSAPRRKKKLCWRCRTTTVMMVR